MADLTKSEIRINQINFVYDETGDLVGLTTHYSQDILDGDTVLTTRSETVRIDEHVADKERAVLSALIKKLAKALT